MQPAEGEQARAEIEKAGGEALFGACDVSRHVSKVEIFVDGGQSLLR